MSVALLIPTSSVPASAVAASTTPTAAASVTAPADAARAPGARKRLYRIPSFKSQEGGRAISTGTVRFIGRNVVDVIGRVNDICPGDGLYGYFQARVVFRNGEGRTASFLTPYGCGSGAARTKNLFTTKPYIVRVTLRTCLALKTGAPPNLLLARSACRFKTFDNPKVRGRG